jgi:DnaA family protein
MTARGAQLALSFPLSSRARFDSFVAGPNGEVVRRLEQLMQGDTFAGCFLHGAAGVGRTHLLQAVCHHHGGAGAVGGAIYLPLADPSVTPASLEGLDTLALVALDDVDAWLGQADAELALLTLYQGLQAGGGRLLVSAGLPAIRLSFCFADLASRLRGLPTYQVQALADADKARVLKRMAQDRGLQLGPAVLNFWLARSARDLASLVDELERLDQAAMAAQRQVTVPLLKQVLGL